MDLRRYRELDEKGGKLTPAERAEGWHFCPDWDQMLIGPDMPNETERCTCERHAA